MGGLGSSPGSLYVPSGNLADMGRDLRAGALGDVITIVVNEATSAVSAGVTNTSRTSTAASGISGLAGALPATSKLSNLLTSSNAQKLQGTGTTSRTSTLTTTLSVRVIVNGKGVVGDAIKRPFFLYRILLGLLPF
jgi:flagellar L-ring protein precursor FlgH